MQERVLEVDVDGVGAGRMPVTEAVCDGECHIDNWAVSLMHAVFADYLAYHLARFHIPYQDVFPSRDIRQSTIEARVCGRRANDPESL